LVPSLAIRGGPSIEDVGCFAYQLNGMIEFFTKGADDNVAKLRADIYKEFGHMRNQDGMFLHRYVDGPAPPMISYQDECKNEKTLTLDMVEKWVNDHDRHDGRLGFFSGFHPTPLFTKVAKPLLSMKTTGSISVERAAKPLKNKVATSERNRLGTDKRSVLLRVGINLRLKALSLNNSAALIDLVGDGLDHDDDDMIFE
jgi:hypothetical protein